MAGLVVFPGTASAAPCHAGLARTSGLRITVTSAPAAVTLGTDEGFPPVRRQGSCLRYPAFGTITAGIVGDTHVLTATIT